MIAPDSTNNQRVNTIATAYYSAYAFGGYSNGVGDAEVFLGVSSTQVVARKTGTLNPTPRTGQATAFNWGVCSYLSLNSENYNEALMTCQGPFSLSSPGPQVYITLDFGTTWTRITGDLKTVSGSKWDFKPQSTIIIKLSDNSRAYIVGTWNGVFASLSSDTSRSWQRLGSTTQFPVVFAQRMYREPITDRLVVATMGRGIYSLTNAAASILNALNPNIDCVLSNFTVTRTCNVYCGGGNETWTRTIFRRSSGTGRACPPVADLVQNRSCNTHICDRNVRVDLKLAVDLSTASSQAFQQKFVNQTAVALNVSTSRLNISSVVPGSVKLTLDISKDPSVNASGYSASNGPLLASALVAQAQNVNSSLVQSLAAVNITVDTSYVPPAPLMQCQNGEWQLSCPPIAQLYAVLFFSIEFH
jgi:hypothetical protein